MAKIGDTIVLDFTTKHPQTGQAAASASSVSVFKNNLTSPMSLSITVAERTGLTGAYFFLLACTVGNGFEVDSIYNVIVTATVAGITQNKRIATFGLSATDTDDLDAVVDTVKVDTAAILLDTAEIGTAGAGLTAIPAPSDMALDSTVAKAVDLTTIDTVVDGIAVQTSRVDALIEDSTGDRFTAKALETASGSGATPQQVWEYSDRQLTAGAFDQSGDIDAIRRNVSWIGHEYLSVDGWDGTPVRQLVVNSTGDQYRCIQSHTSTADDEPGIGINWATYWEATGTGSLTPDWVVSINYSQDLSVPLDVQFTGTLTADSQFEIRAQQFSSNVNIDLWTLTASGQSKNNEWTDFIGNEFVLYICPQSNSADIPAGTLTIQVNSGFSTYRTTPFTITVQIPYVKAGVNLDFLVLKSGEVVTWQGGSINQKADSPSLAEIEGSTVLAMKGDQMDLVDAPNATAVAAITAALPKSGGIM